MTMVVPGAAARLAMSIGNADEVGASLALGGIVHEITYRTRGIPLTDRMDPFVAASLLPVMRTHRALDVDGLVSGALIGNLAAIQRLMSTWNQALRPVTVRANRRISGFPPSAAGKAAVFSGGVDSFYTALAHPNLDALIFVHGFDIGPWRVALLERVASAARAAAAELGKPLIEVRTDLRETTGQYAGWGWVHGSAIASIGLLLAPHFGTLYLPSSLSYDDAHPYGSHPLLDRLWSTEQVRIEHDGFEANRFEKVEAIARSDTALRWLRVCNMRDDEGYNCGSCEKCLRTMVSLHVVGALERCSTLPSVIDLGALAALRGSIVRPLWEQNLAAARRRGSDPRLIRALEQLFSDGARSRSSLPTYVRGTANT